MCVSIGKRSWLWTRFKNSSLEKSREINWCKTTCFLNVKRFCICRQMFLCIFKNVCISLLQTELSELFFCTWATWLRTHSYSQKKPVGAIAGEGALNTHTHTWELPSTTAVLYCQLLSSAAAEGEVVLPFSFSKGPSFHNFRRHLHLYIYIFMVYPLPPVSESTSSSTTLTTWPPGERCGSFPCGGYTSTTSRGAYRGTYRLVFNLKYVFPVFIESQANTF